MKFISVLTIFLILFTLAIEYQTNAAVLRIRLTSQQSYQAHSFKQLAEDASEAMRKARESCSSFISQFKQVLNLGNAYTVNLNFDNLTFAPLGNCERVQMVDRLKIQYSALKKFFVPLRNIRRDSWRNSIRRNLATLVVDIEKSLDESLMVFKNVLTTLRIKNAVMPTSTSPSLAEMNIRTANYLKIVHRGISINPPKVRNYRDLGFAYSLYSSLATVKQEFDQMFLINNS